MSDPTTRPRILPLRSRSVRVFVPLVALCATSAIRIAAQEADGLANRIAIGDQLAQYSYRWDSKNSNGFADLFTDDGVMERQVDGTVVSNSRVVGRRAILDYARTAHQGRLADRQTRHHMSALVFLELSSDSAVTENMALITHQTADDPAPFISASGIYRITWRRTAQGWRIAERVLVLDRFSPR